MYALRVLPEKAENAMASVGRARYRVTLPGNMPLDRAETALKAILDRKTIILPKKTKTREIELDIRPMIFSGEIREGGLLLELAAGSKANLAPEMVLELLAREAGADPGALGGNVRRLDLEDRDGISLGLVGEEAR